MSCDPNTLLDQGRCFDCVAPSMQSASIVELALLCQWLKKVNPMASCDPQTLINQNAGYDSQPGQQSIMKLALLAQISKALNPSADTSPQGLLDAGMCFDCLLEGQKRVVELQLLCNASS